MINLLKFGSITETKISERTFKVTLLFKSVNSKSEFMFLKKFILSLIVE